MGKIDLFVSTVIVLLQTVHKQITSLHCTLYSIKNDARFFCSCINSIIFLKNTCLRGIFEIDFISIDKLWVSDEEREMRMIFFFLRNVCGTCTNKVHTYYCKLVKVLMLAMLSFRTMSVIWSVFFVLDIIVVLKVIKKLYTVTIQNHSWN